MLAGPLAGAVVLTAAWGFAPSAARAATGRERRLDDLKVFLSRKEGELAQLTATHARQLAEADALAQEVEAQKEKPDRNWFEQRTVEKNLARLRAELQQIERGAAREQQVHEESFAAAAAIVSELESLLDDELGNLHDAKDAAARERLLERVQGLERSRRAAQQKMNALMPTIPVPPDLPSNVPWTKEMIEDQDRAYEATINRLQVEREQLVQEQRLRGKYLETVPGGTVAEDSSRQARVDGRLAELDRELKLFHAKRDHLPGEKGKF